MGAEQMRNNHAPANKSRLCRSRRTRHTAAATICLFGPSASPPSGVSEDGVGDIRKRGFSPTVGQAARSARQDGRDLRLRTLTAMGCFCWMVCVCGKRA